MRKLHKKVSKEVILFYENGYAAACCPGNGTTTGCCPKN